MPIYEFICDTCSNEFEVLTSGYEKIKCDKCGGESLTKKFSVFSVNSANKNSSPIPQCSGGCADAGNCPAMSGCQCGHC